MGMLYQLQDGYFPLHLEKKKTQQKEIQKIRS